MNNPLNILPKQASFDLKSSKMRGRPQNPAGGAYDAPPDPDGGADDAPQDPLIVRGIEPSALATHYFVSIFRSQFPFRAPPLLNSWIRHCIHVWTCERKRMFT